MLEISKQPDTGFNFSKAAPEVYIDSVEVYNNKIFVNYHLEDDIQTDVTSPRWINNENIINSLFINIFCNEMLFKETLSSLKKRSRIHNFKLYNTVSFNISSETKTVTIQAFCGNENIIGSKTTEKVLNNGSIEQSTYGTKKYLYINKFKDLRLLELNNPTIEQTKYTETSKNLFISYNPLKKASLGFLFNLDKHLYDTSQNYRLLSKYKYFKDIILKNSYIDTQNSAFYKKCKNTKWAGYQKINSKILKYKLDDSINNSDEFITTIDDNSDLSNRYQYSVKVKLVINNFCNTFIKKYILSDFNKAKQFIENYKNNLQLNLSSDYIEEKNVDFYQYNFESYLDNNQFSLKETIDTLSQVFSFYNSIDINKYYMLFSSMFHPLTAKPSLLDQLLESVNLLKNILNSLVDTDDETLKISENIYEHEFKFIGIDNKLFENNIDYDYDPYFGIEVISADTLQNRNYHNLSGLNIITAEEKNYRKRLELIKYFGTTNENLSRQLNYFSISSIDLNKKSYYLLPIGQTVVNVSFKEIMVYLNQYNDSKYNFEFLEAHYYNLLDKNIYIKNIAERSNESINNLQKTTIFDPNIDSKQKSLQYIVETGIESLYHIVDNNKIIAPENISDDIIQKEATKKSNLYGSNFIITEEILNDYESKPKIIGMYNNFYKDELIVDGANYQIYELKEECVNNLYQNKLRLFNRYYMVEKAKNTEVVQQISVPYVFFNELKDYNLVAKYLNRVEEKQNILLTIEDL